MQEQNAGEVVGNFAFSSLLLLMLCIILQPKTKPDLKPANSPLLWEQMLHSEGLQSSLKYALCRACLTALNLKFNLKS